MTKKHYPENKELWAYFEAASNRYMVQKPVVFSDSFASLQFIGWFNNFASVLAYAESKKLKAILKGHTW